MCSGTCCLIVDNMCKVVEDPAAVLPIMPRLEPLVKAATEKISDPEARGMAERAYTTLTKAGKGAESTMVKPEKAKELLKGLLGDKAVEGEELTHVSSLAATAASMGSFDAGLWKEKVGIIAPFSDNVTLAVAWQ